MQHHYIFHRVLLYPRLAAVKRGIDIKKLLVTRSEIKAKNLVSEEHAVGAAAVAQGDRLLRQLPQLLVGRDMHFAGDDVLTMKLLGHYLPSSLAISSLKSSSVGLMPNSCNCSA